MTDEKKTLTIDEYFMILGWKKPKEWTEKECQEWVDDRIRIMKGIKPDQDGDKIKSLENNPYPVLYKDGDGEFDD
jgi:hypothetical protein